jgi:hypothetical protein
VKRENRKQKNSVIFLPRSEKRKNETKMKLTEAQQGTTSYGKKILSKRSEIF